MAYQSEIEKLKRRYEEKPSQWFAALAEEYRRAGEIEHALDIVRKGLEERANYVSGHIVHARCLQDHGDDPLAHEVLGKVLELDSENVIALKGLADIAERSETPSESCQWLARLLEVDPMNDAAREMLERIEGAEDAAEAPEEVAAADPATPEAPSVEPAAPADVAEALPEPAPGPVEAALAEVDATPDDVDATPDDVAEASPVQDPTRIGELSLEGATDVPSEYETMGPASLTTSPPDAMAPPDPIRVRETSQPAAAPVPDSGPPAASDEVEVLERLPFEPDAQLGAPSEPAVIADVEPSIVPPTAASRESSPGVIGAAVQKDQPVELVPGSYREGVVGAEVERPGSVELGEARGSEEVDHLSSLESRMGEDATEAGVVGATVEQDEPIELQAAGTAEGFDHAAELGDGVGELETEAPAVTSVPDRPAERPVVSEPEPVVTETMAEVYVRQGLLEEARRVYRQLLAQRPDDAGLKARLAELAEGPQPQPPESPAMPAAAEVPARPSFHAGQTGGRSTREFFAQLLAEGHAGPSSGTPLESATPPAGDGVPAGSGGNPPAAAFGDAGSSSPAPRQPGGMSFENFFDEGKSEPNPSGGGQHGAESRGEGDFKHWLKGLKS
ncbi:MAG: tetratricopeptide repeat protein [Gemmatimonadetes bacterium]|nr:tetratricopeptide repeat protein [Gemmatimonadota bacterium]